MRLSKSLLESMSGKDKLTDNVHQIHDRCSRCNGKHSVEKCKFRNTICHGCSKWGTWCPVAQIAEATLKNNTGVYSMEATSARGSHERRQQHSSSKADRASGQFSRRGRGGYSGQSAIGSRQQGLGCKQQQNQLGEKFEDNELYEHNVEADKESEYDTYFGIHDLYRYDGYDDNVVSQDVYKIKVEPYMIDMMIGQKNMKMELDTGASRTIISECMYRSYLSQYKLYKCYAKLRSYTGEVVPVVGEIVVPVQYEAESILTCRLLL